MQKSIRFRAHGANDVTLGGAQADELQAVVEAGAVLDDGTSLELHSAVTRSHEDADGLAGLERVGDERTQAAFRNSAGMAVEGLFLAGAKGLEGEATIDLEARIGALGSPVGLLGHDR